MSFRCLQFFKKTNENNSTWSVIVVKSNFFVRFLGKLKETINCFWDLLTFNISWNLRGYEKWEFIKVMTTMWNLLSSTVLSYNVFFFFSSILTPTLALHSPNLSSEFVTVSAIIMLGHAIWMNNTGAGRQGVIQ